MKETCVVVTNNREKFSIVKALLENFGLNFFNYLMIDSYDDFVPDEEVGTIEERAFQKVNVFKEYLQNSGLTQPALLIGIDDGISLLDGPVSPASKEITREIISGSHSLKKGDEISIVRSYCFYVAKTDAYLHCITTVPFIFLNPKTQGLFQEGIYPLSSFVACIGREIPVGKEDTTFKSAYYENYSSELTPIVERIKEVYKG